MTNREDFLKECLIIDTETTSLNFREAEVIELGYCLYFNTKTWERMGSLYAPTHPILPEVSAITNITNKMVEGRPNFMDCAEGDLNIIIDTLNGRGNLVAHNSFYDRKVLENYNVRDTVPWLCTMRLAQKLYADDDSVKQFNLPYLRYRFELDIPEDMPAHRASTDAYMTGMLLEHIVDDMVAQGIIDDTMEFAPQVEEYIAKPIIMTKMPFGKHKGKPLIEVPLSYWTWALKNMTSLDETSEEFDKDFAASVESAVSQLV